MLTRRLIKLLSLLDEFLGYGEEWPARVATRLIDVVADPVAHVLASLILVKLLEPAFHGRHDLLPGCGIADAASPTHINVLVLFLLGVKDADEVIVLAL